MAELPQLENALRNADAAGDVDAARMLAAEIVRVRGASNKAGADDLSPSSKAADIAKDVAKSGGIGLAEGAIGLAGLPGMVTGGADWLANKGFNLARAAGGYAASGKWEMPQDDVVATERAKGGSLPVVPRPQDVASPEVIKKAVEAHTGEFYKPQTKTGEIVRTVGEFIPGSVLAPGNMLLNVARYGVAPALASETAGQVTKGTQYEPYARAGAAVATGAGAAMLSRPAYSERLVGQAAEAVTQAQYGQAEQLMRDAQARGIQLTPAEAIQHVTGGSTRLGDVQRLTESTVQGGPQMAAAMAQRPAQLQSATNQAFDQVAPRAAQPSFVGREAQEAATGAIDHTRQQINRLAEPFYRAAETVPIPAVEQARLMALPGYAEALQTIRQTPQLNRYVAHLPDNSVGVLNEVKKQLNQSAENVAAVTNPNRNVQVSAGYGRDAGEVTATGERLSRDLADALAVERTGRQQVLGPLQSGPTGTISATDDIAQQGKALFNNVNSPSEVTRAVQNIGHQNPQAATGVVREELGRMADRSVGALDNAARPDQFGGAKLAKMMRGDARQSQNITAAIEAASGPAANQDVQRLLDILQATGQRQRPGSMTAFNAEALADMKRGGIAGLAQSIAKPLSSAKEGLQRMRLGSQSERLAELLLSGPEGVRRIQELAARGNDQAAILARALLSYQAAEQTAH